MATAEDAGIRVEWIDQDIGRILKTRDHHQLTQRLINWGSGYGFAAVAG